MRTVELRARSAFTLIELLVVIGIIALLAGAIGLGLRGGDQTVALQSGQATLNAMVSATRGRAAIAGHSARLLVWADSSDPDRYLRMLAIAVDDGSGSNFTVIGDPVMLPAGAYVVPPSLSSVPTATGVTWDSNVVSGALQGPGAMADKMGTSASWFYTELTTFGTKVGTSSKIVVSTADRSATGLQFNNPNNVRGLTISLYGAVTLIDDASGFH